jgi:hypothetical protein
LSFTDRATSQRQAFLREIATSKLPAGQYVIEVELRDGSGARVVRRNQVWIRGGRAE